MAGNDDAEAAPTADVMVRGPRSLTAEVRQRLPWIEAQLAGGHTRQQVVEALQRGGIPISFTTLKTCLQRARREKNKDRLSAPPEATGEQTEGAGGAPPPTEVSADLAAASPANATVRHMTMEEAMDPRKRAAFTDQFFMKEPLVIKPKRKV